MKMHDNKMQKKVMKMQMLLQECIFANNVFCESGLYLWAAPEPMLWEFFWGQTTISTHSIVYLYLG